MNGNDYLVKFLNGTQTISFGFTMSEVVRKHELEGNKIKSIEVYA